MVVVVVVVLVQKVDLRVAVRNVHGLWHGRGGAWVGYTIHRRLCEIGMCRLKRDPGYEGKEDVLQEVCVGCPDIYVYTMDGGWNEARRDEKTRRRKCDKQARPRDLWRWWWESRIF